MPVKNFDVFVTELCDGNLTKTDTSFTLTQSIDICKQLLEGLEQLEKSQNCHNDLKPENVLYVITEEIHENEDSKISIKIGDFGTAGRSGGTPGWTWPRFFTERKPGRSDMYSVAMLMLYIMCDDRELFYRIRNNYVDKHHAHWFTSFQNDPFFKLIVDMMNLKLTPTKARDRWNEICDQVQVITKQYLRQTFGIDDWYLIVQDEMDSATQNLVTVSLLDR